MTSTLKIIYEDEALLVVIKPAGLPTLEKPGSDGPSLESEIAARYPSTMGIPDHGIAHRLDNDSSGLICIGTSSESYENLRTQFTDGTAVKKYTALAVGIPPNHEIVDAPIAHHPRKKRKMIVCESAARAVELKARPAQTEYSTVIRYHYNDRGRTVPYALLEVTIHTGVRHQVRAHLAWKGYPLAGDRLYQNAMKREEDVLPLKRHFLHASHLTIVHPTTTKQLSFECALPADLADALALTDKG